MDAPAQQPHKMEKMHTMEKSVTDMNISGMVNEASSLHSDIRRSATHSMDMQPMSMKSLRMTAMVPISEDAAKIDDL